MTTNAQTKNIVNRYRREILRSPPDRHDAIIERAGYELRAILEPAQVRQCIEQIRPTAEEVQG